jgi:hypothetical protein
MCAQLCFVLTVTRAPVRFCDPLRISLARRCAEELELDVLIVRKERAVGIIADPLASARVPGAYGGTQLSYEVLEDVALTLQGHLKSEHWKIPYCCFNVRVCQGSHNVFLYACSWTCRLCVQGGHDVFLDVGDKSLGIKALQKLVGATSATTIHVGDRFTRTGNDLRARDVANTLWVIEPAETQYLLTLLTEDMRKIGRGPHDAAGVPAASSRSYWDAVSRFSSCGTLAESESTLGAAFAQPTSPAQTLQLERTIAAPEQNSSGGPADRNSAPASPIRRIFEPRFTIGGFEGGSASSLDGSVTPATPSVARGVGTGFRRSSAAGGSDDPLARPDASLENAALRSQWESAGGVVVGEVHSTS